MPSLPPPDNYAFRNLCREFQHRRMIPVICPEVLLDRPGSWFQLRLPNFAIIRHACRRPLADAARRLVESDFNPRSKLLLISAVSWAAYNSMNVAPVADISAVNHNCRNYDGKFIAVKQRKTDEPLTIPSHRDLRVAPDLFQKMRMAAS